MKIYPVCGWIQGVVQLIASMRGNAAIPLDRVEKVIVGTSAFAVKNNANASPNDTMEAQYSIPYYAAVALAGDAADPRDSARLRFATRLVMRLRSAWRSASTRKVKRCIRRDSALESNCISPAAT